MPEREVHVEGLTELLEKFQALDTKVAKRALRKALRAGGNVFRDELIARTPVYSGTRPLPKGRKAGQLRDDMIAATKVDANQGTGTVSAGPTTHSFYGEFYEFGTSRQPARPFMRPAFDSKGDEALEAFVRVINEEVDEASK